MTVWNIVKENKSKSQRKEQSNICLQYEGKTIRRPEDTCSVFNSHFISMCQTPDNGVDIVSGDNDQDISIPVSVFLRKTSPDEIDKIINNLKTHQIYRRQSRETTERQYADTNRPPFTFRKGGRRKTTETITLKGEDLTVTNAFKYLGVTLQILYNFVQ